MWGTLVIFPDQRAYQLSACFRFGLIVLEESTLPLVNEHKPSAPIAKVGLRNGY